MKGDYFRYLAEVACGDDRKRKHMVFNHASVVNAYFCLRWCGDERGPRMHRIITHIAPNKMGGQGLDLISANFQSLG